MIFRRIAEILLITAILITTGCNTGPNPRLYTTNEGPVAYGANGLSAPAVYKVNQARQRQWVTRLLEWPMLV